MDDFVRSRDRFPLSPYSYIRDDEFDAVMREIFKIRESRVYEACLNPAKDTAP